MSEPKVATPVAEKKRVKKVEQTQKVVISMDKSDAVVLQLNMDEAILLEWSTGSFRRLPPVVVEKLRPDNMRAYLITETKVDQRAARASKVEVLRNPLNPLTGYSESREVIRPRRGWHQCWANPGRDFDEKMRGPYKQVCLPTEDQKKSKYEPGDESGEVFKRLNGEGKVEAIALECPEHLFKAYLEWMSSQSGVRKATVKTDFFTAMENINRELPRDSRIKPIDDTGDLQD